MIYDHQGADMNDRDDLFSNLLRANNEGSEVSLDLQELIANTYMFLVAGIEVGVYSSGHSRGRISHTAQ
jgi:cytochrome P450